MAAPQAAVDESGTDAAVLDEKLIRRIVDEQDHAAFELLYERYFPRVHRFVSRRLSNRADAEETVQEAFINVFASLESFRGEASFAAWVLGVTRRTIAGRFKRKRHTMVPLPEDDEGRCDAVAVGCEPTPLEEYEYRERLDRMQRAADRHLTQEQKRLFELHHLCNRSIHDIAAALGKTEDAVKSNLYRARKVLFAR